MSDSQIPRPPVDRWERYTQAAARHGVPPRAFLDLLIHDPLARMQKLGKRQLIHVVASDADRIAERLQGGAR